MENIEEVKTFGAQDTNKQSQENLNEKKRLGKISEIIKRLNESRHIKIDSLFETIKDAHSVFMIEKKTYDFVININKLLLAIVVLQLILIISMFPLKEKEPYLVGFSNATQNFVHIEKANEKITANDALVRNLIGAYILNRETINRFDDSERYEVVRLQSTTKVWRVFENIIAQENSIYSNENLERNVRIINITKIRNGYANAEIAVGLWNVGKLQYQKRYRVSIMYGFNTLDIDFKSMPKNPTAFQVKEYSVTEIATIKELDEENKVNPKASISRIKKKETNKGDAKEFLLDNYSYKDSDNKDAVSTKDDFDIYESPILEFKEPSVNKKKELISPSEKRKALNAELKAMRENEEAQRNAMKQAKELKDFNEKINAPEEANKQNGSATQIPIPKQNNQIQDVKNIPNNPSNAKPNVKQNQ